MQQVKVRCPRWDLHRERKRAEGLFSLAQLLDHLQLLVHARKLPDRFRLFELVGGAAQGFFGTLLRREGRGFKGILAGDYDHLPEQAFYMVGSIEEAVEKAKTLN